MMPTNGDVAHLQPQTYIYGKLSYINVIANNLLVNPLGRTTNS